MSIRSSILKVIIQRNKSQITEAVDPKNSEQEIQVQSLIGTPIIKSGNYLVPLNVPPKTPKVIVSLDGVRHEGYLISNKPVIIEKDGSTMAFHKYDYIEYLDDPKMQWIVAEVANTDERSDTTFEYSTKDLHWKPLVYHTLTASRVYSALFGKIKSDLFFNVEGATLVADSTPQSDFLARGVNTSGSASSSSSSDGMPEGNWITYQTDKIIRRGDNVIPLKYNSDEGDLIESYSSEYKSRYLITLEPGYTESDREITFKSPFDIPSGEHVFRTPGGISLQSEMREYRTGQQIIQSLGKTADVRANTNISSFDMQNVTRVSIKSTVTSTVDTALTLRYYIGNRNFKPIKMPSAGGEYSISEQHLTYFIHINAGKHHYEFEFQLN